MYLSVLVAVLGQCVEHFLFCHFRSVRVTAIAMPWDLKEEDGTIIITMWLPLGRGDRVMIKQIHVSMGRDRV